jgi:uncharacterized protein
VTVTIWMLGLMVLVGLGAGVLNYAAAGGSLVPFVFMTVLGVPPLVANATCLTATPASFFRAIPDIKITPRVMRVPLLCAAVGTAVGVWIVSQVVTAAEFRGAVPFLLVVSVLFLLFFRRVKAWVDARTHARTQSARLSPRSPVAALSISIAFVSVYAGAFGGGFGVMVIGVLTVATSWPWDTVNTTKNSVCLTTSVVGAFAFAPTGLVNWPLCITLAASMVVGSLVGKWVTRVVSAKSLRLLVAVMTTLSAGYLWATS